MKPIWWTERKFLVTVLHKILSRVLGRPTSNCVWQVPNGKGGETVCNRLQSGRKALAINRLLWWCPPQERMCYRDQRDTRSLVASSFSSYTAKDLDLALNDFVEQMSSQADGCFVDNEQAGLLVKRVLSHPRTTADGRMPMHALANPLWLVGDSAAAAKKKMCGGRSGMVFQEGEKDDSECVWAERMDWMRSAGDVWRSGLDRVLERAWASQ